MAQGTVKWYDSEKGHGGNTTEGGNDEIFVHYSDIQSDGYRHLEEGWQVQFDVQRAQKGGLRATNVRKLE